MLMLVLGPAAGTEPLCETPKPRPGRLSHLVGALGFSIQQKGRRLEAAPIHSHKFSQYGGRCFDFGAQRHWRGARSSAIAALNASNSSGLHRTGASRNRAATSSAA
jgi:hypothetical protein